MADERLRRLERERDAGDPDAAARLVQEHVRTGELTPGGVRLLAYLGDPAAQRVEPGNAPDTDPRPEVELEAWLRGLSGWGKPALVRAAIALALDVLPAFEDVWPGERRARGAVEAAQGWLSEPREASRVAARFAAEEADEAARDATVMPEAGDDAAFAAFACRDAAQTAAEPDDERATAALLAALDAFLAIRYEADGLSLARRCIRGALEPWARGADGP